MGSISRFKEAISSNSVNELLVAVDVLRDNNFITDDEFNEIYKQLNSTSNQLGFQIN